MAESHNVKSSAVGTNHTFLCSIPAPVVSSTIKRVSWRMAKLISISDSSISSLSGCRCDLTITLSLLRTGGAAVYSCSLSTFAAANILYVCKSGSLNGVKSPSLLIFDMWLQWITRSMFYPCGYVTFTPTLWSFLCFKILMGIMKFCLCHWQPVNMHYKKKILQIIW